MYPLLAIRCRTRPASTACVSGCSRLLPLISSKVVASLVAMRGKISKRAVDAIDEGILWDTELRGFGVRARSAGKTYVLKFRIDGKQRWHTLGRHGSPWTPELARREAKRILGEVAVGRAPAVPSGPTVEEAVEAFVKAYCLHLRSGGHTAAMLRRHVISRWGTRRLTSIGHSAVVHLLRDVQGVALSNKLRRSLSRFFRWAVAEALVVENPVERTEPRRGEVARNRVLTNGEVAAVWAAADDWPFGSIVRLLLATGQRRNEVGGMRWQEIDLAGKLLWTLPHERHKSGREHIVPLNDLAVGVFAGCPRVGDVVFSLRHGFSGWSRAKRRLDARCGVHGWHLHDIRRTVATGMQAAGVPPHVVAAVLGHSTAGLFGVTATYLRDRQEEAKREAMRVWEERLRLILREVQ